ncbi:MAG TPA: NAD-dependent epimerase/dehydratase family protein [Opitutaceae bacterium]
MRVLITGGAGFIGSHLAEHFCARAEVRVLDNLRTGYRRNLEGLPVEFIEGSVLDRDAVRTALDGVDYVFHLAALVSVPESVHAPRECVEINVLGLLNVLEFAAAAGVKKLCFASSAAVYGNDLEVPKREDMRPAPRSPYAVTKLDGEYYCEQFTESGRLATAALRFFNVFGPRQDPNGPYGAAVPIFFRQALAEKSITIYGDGEQTRDFIYVKDIVAALAFAATCPEATGVFNAGYGTQLTVGELARKIVELTQSHSKIEYAPARAGDVRHSRANVDRLRQAGFSPRGSVDAGLIETLNVWRR